MNDLSGEVRRLCVALDTEDPGGATLVTRDHAHRRLVDLVTEAVARAGLDRLYLADRGATPDERGAFFLLPSGVNEARVVAGLTGELRLALRRRNHGLGSSSRLRVRAAFHQGPTRVADTGFVGRAVDAVHDLRDTPEVRAELHRHPHADLAVVLSAQLFEDVIGCDHRDLRKSLFRRLLVPSPDGVGEAWLSLPGTDIPSQTRPYHGVTAAAAYAPTPPAGH